jgi:aryl-alcohol dehydrogenase-like predicted oxidoreductase
LCRISFAAKYFKELHIILCMNYEPFGGTGIKVSRLIYGTWYLPHEDVRTANGMFPVSRERSFAMINRALELGINFFDTANVYRGVYDRKSKQPGFENVGLSEQILGEALSAHDRESYVLVTKVTGRTGPLQNDQGHNRKHIMKAVRDSLSRLKTDYIDIYLLHGPDSSTSLENSIRSMNHLIDEGNILHYGVSNFQPEQVEEMFGICRHAGLEPPSAVQDVYNMIDRNFETGKLKVVEKHNIGAMIYSPLAQGVLAGRYSADSKDVSRKEYDAMFADRVSGLTTREIVKTVGEISASRSTSMARVSLSWMLSKSRNVFPIVGATRIEQLDDSAGAPDLRLSEEDIRMLEGVNSS